MPAHCSLDMADVPLSVSRSMRTASAGSRNGFRWAAGRCCSRCSRVVIRTGSTILIRNGSMIVFMARAPGRGRNCSRRVGVVPVLVGGRGEAGAEDGGEVGPQVVVGDGRQAGRGG